MFLLEFIPGLSSLHIVYLTQILTLDMFIYIGSSFLFAEMILPYFFNMGNKFQTFSYVILFLIVSLSSYNTSVIYRNKQESLNMLSNDDIKVFDWIDNNLNEKDRILNNAIIGRRKNIVYASDSGAWITSFTNKKLAHPFTEFASKEAHQNYSKYLKILQESATCEDINYFIDKDIKYYYRGAKPVFGDQIRPKENSRFFKSIYSFGKAELFEIIRCKE